MSAVAGSAGIGKGGLKLYRHILREHRHLPSMMKKLGDDYVRQEFRQHLNAKPEFLDQFTVSWTNYLAYLKKNRSESTERYGRDLETDAKRVLNDEQIDRLRELKSKAYDNTHE
jgi:hypothetical protein